MLDFIRTSFACPEQYEAFLGKRRVGYLRLRHGNFVVECPDCGGEEVYQAHPEGSGIFEEAERSKYLKIASACILAWCIKNGYLVLEYGKEKS